MDKDGGGMRNAFGKDFKRNGQVWDRCLCERDSDGDGKTNGEELGDPECKWKPGEIPEITALSKISHPGICNPIDSPECRLENNWEFCKEDDFACDAIKDEEVRSFNLRFPKTSVPAVETTYICMLMDVPAIDGDWHVIASEPLIDNANVMHHITVRLCTDAAADALNGQFDEPAPCGMATDTCTGTLTGWTVGMNGDCMPDTYGIRYGNTTGYTKALVQFHWNNPEGVKGYTDASGMKYYYTPKLRNFDISGATMGPIELNIPPKQLYYEQTGLCNSKCSKVFLNGTTRYITEVFPHMHYLGRGFVMEHWRGEEKLEDLVNTTSYSYDNPIGYRYDPPREYRPGDTLITRCFFNSMAQDKRTYFGEGTQEEMCLAFVSFYPGPDLSCFGASDTTFCPMEEEDEDEEEDGAETEVEDGVLQECNITSYFTTSFEEHFRVLIAGGCDMDGLSCSAGCQEALEKVYAHPCMQGNYRYFIRAFSGTDKQYGVPFLHLLSSCHAFEVQKVQEPSPAEGTGDLCPPGASLAVATATPASLGTLLILALMACRTAM